MRSRLIELLRADGYEQPLDGDGGKRFPVRELPKSPDSGLLFQDARAVTVEHEQSLRLLNTDNLERELKAIKAHGARALQSFTNQASSRAVGAYCIRPLMLPT